MNRIYRIVLLLFLLSAVTFSATAKAQVLDFENLPNADPIFTFQGKSITQNGFTIASDVEFATYGPGVGTFNGIYTGSVAVVIGGDGAAATLTKNSGGAFALKSIDLAYDFTLAYSDANLSTSPLTVNFVGTTLGGATVNQSFTHGRNKRLETFTFGSEFGNVTRVSFAEALPDFQFDNIVLSAAVPEPGAVSSLSGFVVCGIGFALRRRQRKVSDAG